MDSFPATAGQKKKKENLSVRILLDFGPLLVVFLQNMGYILDKPIKNVKL